MFPKLALQLLLLFLTLCQLTQSLPNPAPYIAIKNRPLNIAHRGLCSLLPENTLQAFEAALYQGADFIQLDVVYTKEKTVLVMHDPYLTRITNIRDFPQFSTRYQTRNYEGTAKTDWWTDQFTLAELRRLGIKQDQAPGRLTVFDYKFGFPTLDEVVKMVVGFNAKHQGKRNPDGRIAGILIEAKDSQMYRDLYGLEIGESVLQVLRDNGIETIQKCQKTCPIYLHSFDYNTVKYWSAHSDLPRNYLLEGLTKFDIQDIAQYATGIGFQDTILWNYTTSTPTPVLQRARQLGLLIHIWTFKDDQLLFGAKDSIRMYEIGQLELCLDGVITEFADVYAVVSQMLAKRDKKCVGQGVEKVGEHSGAYLRVHVH